MVIRLTRDSPLVKLLYRIARDVSLGCHETLVNALLDNASFCCDFVAISVIGDLGIALGRTVRKRKWSKWRDAA
jgi:hypothetical protein